jgi:hypothetical protein
MTDDIVTRLRRIASLTGDISGHIIPTACTDAVEEIEHLRREIASNLKDIQTLTRVCEKAYKRPEGYTHHEGCLAGMMCSCGLMHYHAWKESKK